MNTGGPAFPLAASTGDPRDGVYCQNGMTLLDWMAGQALAGLFASPASRMPFDVMHRLAYDHASAMLDEKARREADHSGDANKMVERNRELVERQNAQLRSLLRQAELAIAFANREPNVIRMLGDDYTEVLQLVRAALKEEKP